MFLLSAQNNFYIILSSYVEGQVKKKITFTNAFINELEKQIIIKKSVEVGQ